MGICCCGCWCCGWASGWRGAFLGRDCGNGEQVQNEMEQVAVSGGHQAVLHQGVVGRQAVACQLAGWLHDGRAVLPRLGTIPSPVPQLTLPNDPLKICNKEKDGEGGRCDRNLVLQAALGKRPRVAASGGSGGSATVAPVFRRWRFSAPLTQYRTFPRLVLGSRVPIQSKASSIAAARPPLLLLLLLLIAARLLPLVLATGAAKDSKHRRSDAARPLILLLHCTARQ